MLARASIVKSTANPYLLGTMPRLRHWFSGPALLGLAMTSYNALLAIIGIAPITEGHLKWWLVGIAVLLSVVTWLYLAQDRSSRQARADERSKTERRLEAMLNALPDQVAGEVEGYRTRLEDALREAGTSKTANAELTSLFNDVVGYFDRACRNDILGVEAIGAARVALAAPEADSLDRVAQAKGILDGYLRRRVPGKIVLPGDVRPV